MFFFANCFFVVVWPFHEALVIDAVPHPESVAQFMVDYLYQKLNILLRFIFLSFLSFPSQVFDNNLLKWNQTSPVFDGAKAKNPFFF